MTQLWTMTTTLKFPLQVGSLPQLPEETATTELLLAQPQEDLLPILAKPDIARSKLHTYIVQDVYYHVVFVIF